MAGRAIARVSIGCSGGGRKEYLQSLQLKRAELIGLRVVLERAVAGSDVDWIRQRHDLLIEAQIIGRLGFSGERLLGKMVHAEEIVVGRADVASKGVALEEQV